MKRVTSMRLPKGDFTHRRRVFSRLGREPGSRRRYPAWVLLVSGLVLLAGGTWISSLFAHQPDDEAVKVFMRAKLDASQKILEGLVTEDFDLMREASNRISVMGRRAEWNAIKTPDYVQQTTDFQRAAQRLAEAAKEKSLDGASLAYLQLTLSCVNCHKYVRGVKIAQNEPPDRTWHREPALALLLGEDR